MIINNNLVWKFNKDNEFPKSVFRTNNRVAIRDKADALYFNDTIADPISKELESERDNTLQFTTKYTDVIGSTIPDVPVFTIRLTYCKLFVFIFPYKTEEDNTIKLVKIYEDDSYLHLRDLFCDFGCSLVEAITHEMKMAQPRAEMKKSEEDKSHWYSSITSLFSSKKKEKQKDWDGLISPIEREIITNINLNEIVPSLMDKHVYSQKLSKEDLDLLKSLTLVIHLG